MADFDAPDLFRARLAEGIIELARHALGSSPKNEFDAKYEPVLNALQACRRAKTGIIELVSDHRKKITQNKIVRFHDGHFEVLESIDAAAKENLASFIARGAWAVKGIQDVLDLFDLDIECLFQKPDKFHDGINILYASGRHFLASYLKQVRDFWSEKFIARSDELERQGWTLPDFTYKRLSEEKIEAVEPMIDGLSLSDYSIIMLNRICSFIENILCHGIRQKIDPHETIVEILPSERNPGAPVRFKIVPRPEAVTEWDIRYSEEDFLPLDS